MGTLIGCILMAVAFGGCGFVVGFVIGYDARADPQESR